jgi:hypothetical protein
MRESPKASDTRLFARIGSKNSEDIMDNPQGRFPGRSIMGKPSETTRLAASSRIEAQWVVGFVDGEGCFFVGINRHPEMTMGFQILPEFTVVQHQRDIQILYALKCFFGCGVVRVNHADRMAYRVRSIEHLKDKIVPFFEKHSLRTKKNVDFIKFRKIIQLMNNQAHLNTEGIEEIKQIACTMNRGS